MVVDTDKGDVAMYEKRVDGVVPNQALGLDFS